MYKLSLWYVDDKVTTSFMTKYPPVFGNGVVSFVTEDDVTTVVPLLHVWQVDMIEMKALAAEKTTADNRPADFKPEAKTPQ